MWVVIIAIVIAIVNWHLGGRLREYSGGHDKSQAVLTSLPAHIRSKVKINARPPSANGENTFAKYIGTPAILEMESIISRGCVKAKSLYELSVPVTRDGFNLRRLPAGTHIYKAFQGFLTNEQILAFVRKHPERPSWLGNKYLCYFIARNTWGSIVSFKLTRDIYLIDYFDKHNLERLMREAARVDSTGAMVKTMKYATGYKTPVSEQIKFMDELYDWKEIWYYTRPVLPKYTYAYCNIRDRGLNPIGAIRNVHAVDMKMFKQVLKRYNIDGIIREQIKSAIDEHGVFYHEELLIKGSTLAEMEIDTGDPLHWSNWGLRDIKPIDLREMVSKFAMPPSLHPNMEFRKVRFYHDNEPKWGRSGPNHADILSYNVHMFASLNSAIINDKNAELISELVRGVNPGLFVLQEYDEGPGARFEADLAKSQPAYNIYRCQNGAPPDCPDKSYIVVGVKANKTAGIAANTAADTTANTAADTTANTAADATASIAADTAGTNVECRALDTTVCQEAITGLAGVSIRDNVLFEYNGGPTKHVRAKLVDREQLILKWRGLTVAAVHLEIGLRYQYLDIVDTLRAINSHIRIWQLGKIIAAGADTIIGDFNCTRDSPEMEYLAANGYTIADTITSNTTPYNRVDFIVTKHPSRFSAEIIKCNYSDHLPLAARLTS